MDDKSRALFDKACQLIPGGVNSPVRACHTTVPANSRPRIVF